jgi:hypothetical protein
MIKTVILEPIGERTTRFISAQLVDQNENPISGGSLQTLTLTLYNVDATNTIINSVNDVNILNIDRGTVDGNGNVVIELQPADNQLIDTTKTREIHRALIEWTYGGTGKTGRHIIEFVVANMTRVP